MFGELRIVDDVAPVFAECVIDAYEHREHDDFSIAVSGGPTARRCYERLADDSVDRVDWWNIDVYWGDERCVPTDDEASNERLVREALLERVGGVHAAHPLEQRRTHEALVGVLAVARHATFVAPVDVDVPPVDAVEGVLGEALVAASCGRSA